MAVSVFMASKASWSALGEAAKEAVYAKLGVEGRRRGEVSKGE